MVTCPFCWGMYDVKKIQLEEIVTDSQNFYVCKKCKKLFEINEIDPETLESTWSEDFLSGLQYKIDAILGADVK